MFCFSLTKIFFSIILGSEKADVESHDQMLCLDGDLDLLYSLLVKSEDFLKKKNAKKLIKYTINLDLNLRRSIALKRSRLFQTKDDFTKSLNSDHLDEPDEKLSKSDKKLSSQSMVVRLIEQKKVLPQPAGEVIKLRNRKTAQKY